MVKSTLPAAHGCGTLPSMPPAKRRPDTSWLPTVVPTVQGLLDHGEATRGMTVKTWGGHLVLGRVDAAGPDPRFRLTPLGGGRYGLSLLRPQPLGSAPLRGHAQRVGRCDEYRSGCLGRCLAGRPCIGPGISGTQHYASHCVHLCPELS